MQEKNILQVSVAVIKRRDGRILFAQRPAGKACEGEWEFPGGKIEADESARQALIREIEEELAIHITEARPWINLVHHYPHAIVHLHFFIVTGWTGNEQPVEGQRLSWQNITDMNISPLLAANGPVIRALRLPDVYSISCASVIGEEAFLERLQISAENGLQLLQLREKEMSACQLKRLVDRILPITVPAGIDTLINSALPIEQQQRFSGIHLTSRHLMEQKKRPGFELAAASCHNQQELDQAIRLQLDFAVLSPVFKTASHPDAEPLGINGMKKIISECPIPVYALGGMSLNQLHEIQSHGAHGIAMMRNAWK